jgi:hypothetical protein
MFSGSRPAAAWPMDGRRVSHAPATTVKTARRPLADPASRTRRNCGLHFPSAVRLTLSDDVSPARTVTSVDKLRNPFR